jgi:ketosteroid isomerase-like protein
VIESNVEIARRGFAAVLSGNFDAVAEFLDPDVKWHGGDPGAEGACRGREEALEVIRQAYEQGFSADIVSAIGVGDRVVVVLRQAGSGRTIANLTRFRDGRAVEMVHYPDPDDAFAAAGLGS